MESPAYVCLFVTTITKYNVDGSGLNFLRRFLGGKASPSSFSVMIASQKNVSLFVIDKGSYSQEKPPVNIYTLIHMHVVNK